MKAQPRVVKVLRLPESLVLAVERKLEVPGLFNAYVTKLIEADIARAPHAMTIPPQ
jgi:hypothetical protein